MKILMLVNWVVHRYDSIPADKQPPDYFVEDEAYWFFKYFQNEVEVDIADIHSFGLLEKFEKNYLRFYVLQTLRVLPRLRKYDLIISHGMQSGILLSLLRRVFHLTTPKHVVFDIGAFNSAAESGWMLKFMGFSSKSIDGIIYHTSKQIEYYQKFYPWLVDKSKFIRFGTDAEFFSGENLMIDQSKERYILCVGQNKRDWNTLFKAYHRLHTNIRLRLIGYNKKETASKNIECIPFMPIKELMREIKNALFCVLPLEYMNYSFGQMTLLQQMILKKTVIVARVPSITDYVRDTIDTILYEPNNDKDLAEKMDYLIHNSDLCEKIGEQAYVTVRNTMNERIMANEIEKYIFEIGSCYENNK